MSDLWLRRSSQERKFYQKFYFDPLCPKSCTGVQIVQKLSICNSDRDPNDGTRDLNRFDAGQNELGPSSEGVGRK